MVEIIPKPTPKKPITANLPIYLGIALLIAVFAGLLVAGHFSKKAVEKKQSLETELAEIKALPEMSLEKEISEKAKKISDFGSLWKNHQDNSYLFPFLGKICHPKVQFTQFSLIKTEEANRVEIAGKAASYAVVYQQLLILETEDLIKEPLLSGVSLGSEGVISFKLSFNLDSSIFSFK